MAYMRMIIKIILTFSCKSIKRGSILSNKVIKNRTMTFKQTCAHNFFLFPLLTSASSRMQILPYLMALSPRPIAVNLRIELEILG